MSTASLLTSGAFLLCRTLGALFAVLASIPLASAQEQNRVVAVGLDGAGTRYELGEFSFGEHGCDGGLYLSSMLKSGGASLSFQLNNDDTGEIQLLAPAGQPDTYHGVEVVKYVLDPFPYDLRPSPLTLFAPVDDGYAVALDSNGLCSNYGFEAKLIWVLIDPTLQRDFEAWLASNEFAIDMDSSATGYKNLFRIDVGAGKEELALSEMQDQPWYIDSKRYSIPAGPHYAHVTFSSEDVFGGSPTQNAARDALIKAVKSIYGDLVNPDELVANDTFEFEWEFLAPAEVVLPDDNRFSNYWLKADIRFTFSNQGHGQWRLRTDATDGYLPYWGRSGTPSPGVVTGGHLAKEGANDTTNFASLIAFQARLVTRLGEIWNGEAYTND